MLYLVTFDLHGAPQPPGDIYTGIWKDIRDYYGENSYCKDFGQFCIVRTNESVGTVKNVVRRYIQKKSNRFESMDLVVFSVGEKISISRGARAGDLQNFRKFFLSEEQPDF